MYTPLTRADRAAPLYYFEIGRAYQRGPDIHDRFGGQRQGGISTPTQHDVIFLFTGESGLAHSYHDGWEDGVYVYTGEGQHGDMIFVRGNKAIRDHAQDGKELLLFEKEPKKGRYIFRGVFACASWEHRSGIDSDGTQRQTIAFYLVPQTAIEITLPLSSPDGELLSELRNRAYAAASEVSENRNRTGARTYYERSADVHRYVLMRAEGKCEACGSPAPFQRLNGEPYLESHHTQPSVFPMAGQIIPAGSAPCVPTAIKKFITASRGPISIGAYSRILQREG